MSLQAFQRALSDLISSPRLCLELREEPDRVLDRYELSLRERRRLIGIVRQPGMSTSCSLYRSNRLVALYTLLPLTCLVLGGELRRAAEAFWDEYVETDLQFKRECDRFGEFLKRHTSWAGSGNTLLWDVLQVELAQNELRFLPRSKILRTVENEPSVPQAGAIRLHPLARIVELQHDPMPLLCMLTEAQQRPKQLLDRACDIPRGEYFLLLDTIGEEMQFRRIDPSLARILLGIAESGGAGLAPVEIQTLVEAHLVVPTASGTTGPSALVIGSY
jgi:hypothetical protein